jgi:hypothetical protein
MALSMGFQDSVAFLLAIQATGLWLLPEFEQVILVEVQIEELFRSD